MYFFSQKIRSPAEAKTTKLFCLSDLKSFYDTGTLTGQQILQLQFIGDFTTAGAARDFLVHQELAFQDIVRIYTSMFKKESELNLIESNGNR